MNTPSSKLLGQLSSLSEFAQFNLQLEINHVHR